MVIGYKIKILMKINSRLVLFFAEVFSFNETKTNPYTCFLNLQAHKNNTIED